MAASWRWQATVWILLVSALVGCGGPAPPVVAPAPPPARAGAFLIDPFEGYAQAVGGALALRVREAYDTFKRGGSATAAAAEASAILEVDAAFHPASVLLAQAALAENDAEGARASATIASRTPDYTAAQWVLAIAAEDLGEVVTALMTYEAIADAHPAASEAAQKLVPRAVAITQNRFTEAMERGHLEDAERELTLLHGWAPDDMATIEGARALARGLGDVAAERAVLERLVMMDPERQETMLRLAELEIEAGALRSGLSRLEDLALRFPEDRTLSERVERAKFVWRLENFPTDVRALSGSPELTRADLATWLYWLVPEVRYAPLDAPPVATDILDHERRDEIVRVLNLGLLDIDDLVHRFEPARRASRSATLAALLRVLARAEPVPACLDGVDPRRLTARTFLTCEIAARCGLLADAADCLPGSGLTGSEALELFRLGLASVSP